MTQDGHLNWKVIMVMCSSKLELIRKTLLTISIIGPTKKKLEGTLKLLVCLLQRLAQFTLMNQLLKWKVRKLMTQDGLRDLKVIMAMSSSKLGLIPETLLMISIIGPTKK